ncbi:uncharacterized protein KZ484_023550 [Pholidichthys leucotaenia]
MRSGWRHGETSTSRLGETEEGMVLETSRVVMETSVSTADDTEVAMTTEMEARADKPSQAEEQPKAAVVHQTRHRTLGRRSQRGKRRGIGKKRRGVGDKRRSQKQKRRGQQEEQKEGVTVKRTFSGEKRRWDKKHYCVFCRRPQVKIARHLLRKHADEQEVVAASALPTGSKERHLLLEHLRCRGNYLHNIEVIRQGSGEIVPWRRPSEEMDARKYLPCPLCLGFFLRADLWKHQVSCRKKLAIDPSNTETTKGDASEFTGRTGGDSEDRTTEDTPSESSGDATKRPLTTDSTESRPRKRNRVQAAASRLLPISSGASESCSEILHRMNQDNVSYEVKSDWLICKYGNKLMGNEDGGGQRRYDYVSQKLRELGKLLLAAKSLDSEVQSFQDLLTPGRLGLTMSAARKAAGYRWIRPPLVLKTTLKMVCEIAIGDSLQDGDWEAAAKTTDFYHMLGRDWDNLVLQNLGPDPDVPEGSVKVKKRFVQSKPDKAQTLEFVAKTSNKPVLLGIPATSPDSVPFGPRKVRRRPWSSAEKEAIWRQLGGHVLFQSVPGKEACQRCLDLEPVLRGRHWKDIKNQVHNQIQSQKKQQFHAQMDLEKNQEQQDQNKQQQQNHNQAPTDQQEEDHTQIQKKPQYQSQIDQLDQENLQNQKGHQHHIQMDHQAQDNLQNPKTLHDHSLLEHQDHLQQHKKLYHPRPDPQDHNQVLKKQLYQLDQQSLQTLDRDSSFLTVAPYGSDVPHRAHGHSLLDREPTVTPFQFLHQNLGTHMDQWNEEILVQNYQNSRPLGRNLLEAVPPVGPQPVPHSGHVHF